MVGGSSRLYDAILSLTNFQQAHKQGSVLFSLDLFL